MRLKFTILGLTPAGKARMDKVVTNIQLAATKELSRSIRQLVKPQIVANAPTPLEEAAVLSTDVGGVGTSTPSSDGTVRFAKRSGQRYVRDALSMEPVTVKPAKTSVFVNYGRIRLINRMIGYSWQASDRPPQVGGKGAKRVGKKRPRGKKVIWRSTNQMGAYRNTWGNLLEFWEIGHSYTVRRRAGVGMLHPENGVYVAAMNKIIPKKAMVAKGYFGNRKSLQQSIAQKILQAVRRVK